MSNGIRGQPLRHAGIVGIISILIKQLNAKYLVPYWEEILENVWILANNSKQNELGSWKSKCL